VVAFLYVKESNLEKYNGEPDMKTKQLRAKLYFLQFIENKILTQKSYCYEGRDGFSKWMALHMK
jgi:hypothetical protein